MLMVEAFTVLDKVKVEKEEVFIYHENLRNR